MNLQIYDELALDNSIYGGCRYVVTNDRDEFSIKRVHPTCDVYLSTENYYG